MGYIDNNLILSSAQAVTATVVSTSFIDQSFQAEAVARSLWVVFLINTTFTPNSATIRFEVECDDSNSFDDPTTLFMTGALADTLLVAGFFPAKIRMPLGAAEGVQRFIEARYTVTGTAVAGKIDCRLVNDIQNLII